MEDEGLVNKLIIKILRLFLIDIPNSSSEERDTELFGNIICFELIGSFIDGFKSIHEQEIRE